MDNYADPGALQAALLALAEPDYAAFSRALLPGVRDLLGVRLPRLRALAKRIARDGAREFLDARIFGSFETRMLHGMVLGCAAMPLGERMDYLRAFLPVIDNWSVCDSTVAGLKCVRDAREEFDRFLSPCFDSPLEYVQRFGFVMLLNYYTGDAWFARSLARAAENDSELYYVRMARAWLVAECFAAHPGETLRFLERGALRDDFTHNKAISKICDSRLSTPEQKAAVRALRRRA